MQLTGLQRTGLVGAVLAGAGLGVALASESFAGLVPCALCLVERWPYRIAAPLALFGAVIFIFLGFASINIYTQVGLVTLMGLISKHGILIVEVANNEQKKGHTKLDAIIEATGIRLRPILMTTAAMVFGVLPLVIASGAGAAGRSAMGLVIFTGMSIGTLFTLFVVPAFYMLIGSNHTKEVSEDEALDDDARKTDGGLAPKPGH